jgi:hypothetical protein
MIIPETVVGSGVKFTRVGTTVGEDAGSRIVAEGMIPGEVGSEDTDRVTEVGKIVAGPAGVGECAASVVGDSALALRQATNPSTSIAPTKTTQSALLILSPDYLPT